MVFTKYKDVHPKELWLHWLIYPWSSVSQTLATLSRHPRTYLLNWLLQPYSYYLVWHRTPVMWASFILGQRDLQIFEKPHVIWKLYRCAQTLTILRVILLEYLPRQFSLCYGPQLIKMYNHLQIFQPSRHGCRLYTADISFITSSVVTLLLGPQRVGSY